jgi:hypothetical protein
MSLLPDEAAYNYSKLAPYGFIILIALLYFGIINGIFMPVLLGIEKLLNFLIRL